LCPGKEIRISLLKLKKKNGCVELDFGQSGCPEDVREFARGILRGLDPHLFADFVTRAPSGTWLCLLCNCNPRGTEETGWRCRGNVRLWGNISSVLGTGSPEF
jgi:hypothetical protein